jgi:hypothetical protein
MLSAVNPTNLTIHDLPGDVKLHANIYNDIPNNRAMVLTDASTTNAGDTYHRLLNCTQGLYFPDADT